MLLFHSGDVGTWMWGHRESLDDWVEGIIQRVVDLVVVQDQRVGCEDLGDKTEKKEMRQKEGIQI